MSAPLSSKTKLDASYRQSLIRRLWEFQTQPTCPDEAKRAMAEAAQELESLPVETTGDAPIVAAARKVDAIVRASHIQTDWFPALAELCTAVESLAKAQGSNRPQHIHVDPVERAACAACNPSKAVEAPVSESEEIVHLKERIETEKWMRHEAGAAHMYWAGRALGTKPESELREDFDKAMAVEEVPETTEITAVDSPSAICAIIGCKIREQHVHGVVEGVWPAEKTDERRCVGCGEYDRCVCDGYEGFGAAAPRYEALVCPHGLPSLEKCADCGWPGEPL